MKPKSRLLLTFAFVSLASLAPLAGAETLASAPLVGGPSLYCYVANVSSVPVKVRSVELISAVTGQQMAVQACGTVAPGLGCSLAFQAPAFQPGAYCRALHLGVEGSLTGVLQVLGNDGTSVGTTHMWRLPSAVAP